MSVVSPEVLVQPRDFVDPTVLDVFAHEEIFDVSGFPYLSFSPTDYHPDGPQMELGLFVTDDVTGRKEHGGVVNVAERRNAQIHFGGAMDILRTLRGSFVFTEVGNDRPLTNSEALRMTHMGIELPRYLIWTKHAQYRNGELPPETILLNRALRGFHGLISRQSYGTPQTQENRKAFMDAPFSVQDTLDFILEKNGLEGDLVCAGHWHMITTMVNIIGGTDKQYKIGTAEIDFVPRELRDFSKSLRALWDVVYPNLERGVSRMNEVEKAGVLSVEQREKEVMPPILHALQTANMANFLMRSVIGQPQPPELSLEELLESLANYSDAGKRREKELKREIANFKST